MPRILVVEDDQRLAAVLERTLRYEGYQVDVVNDGPHGLHQAVTTSPDLCILDVMLPGFDGIDLCRKLRRDSDVPVLMLTARDSTSDRVRGLDSGADDYVVKPFATEEMLARVRALLRRRGVTDPFVVRVAGVELDARAHEARRGGHPLQLTAREFRLLECFMRSARRVLTREQLLDTVWEGELDVSTNVVDVYVGYLRQKLEHDGASRVIHTVRGVGFVMREEPV